MTLSLLRREAREALKGKWGSAVLLMLVYAFVTIVFPIVVEVVLSGGWDVWIEQENVPTSVSIVKILFLFVDDLEHSFIKIDKK